MPYALITGASKGIGLAIAEELARRQFDVLLVARSESLLRENADRLARTYNVKTAIFAADLAAPGAAQRVFDWCRQQGFAVNTLVNNAGYGLSGPFEKHALAEHIDMMHINMTTLVELCHLFLPQLRQQPRAYVLNIASSTAYQAIPRLSLYSATKVFVLSFSRGLAHELKKTGVTVTCVSPGATETGFVERAQIGEKGRKAAERVYMQPADVARQAVRAMLAGQLELVPGLLNKLGKFMAWLMPKSVVEQAAGSIYD